MSERHTPTKRETGLRWFTILVFTGVIGATIAFYGLPKWREQVARDVYYEHQQRKHPSFEEFQRTTEEAELRTKNFGSR